MPSPFSSTSTTVATPRMFSAGVNDNGYLFVMGGSTVAGTPMAGTALRSVETSIF